MGAHQLQPDRKRNSIGLNWYLWMWVAVVWLGQTVGWLAVRAKFISTAWTEFLEPILFRDILLSLGGGKSSGPASKQCARLCWLPMGSLTFSEEWMGDGVGGGWREQEEKRQWELGLVCKKLKDGGFFQINKEKKENLLFNSYRNKAARIQRELHTYFQRCYMCSNHV